MYIFQPDRYLLKKQVNKFSKYIKGKVLDVGAGDFGRYEGFFSGEEYLKMDVKRGDNVDMVGSAENIPLPDGSVDSVVCTQVFEHLKYPERSAREIYRVLKTGGHCLVTVPQTNELHEEPHDYFRYTNFGLQSLFEENGFTSVAYDQRGGFFTLVAQLKIRYWIDRYQLYKRPFWGRVMGKFIKLYGLIMMWLDSRDLSKANRKHALGWAFVFKK
jgi:SAM-dependent methyltransferase